MEIAYVNQHSWRVFPCSPMSNFPPKQIGKFMSEILVLGVPDAGGEVVLVVPERRVPDGGRMY